MKQKVFEYGVLFCYVYFRNQNEYGDLQSKLKIQINTA